MLNKKVVEIKKNKSLTYMLPFIDKQLNLKFNNLLLNSYISYDGEDEIFCILYDWKSDLDFLKFEGELMEHSMFIEHEDYGNKVLYKFKTTKSFKEGKEKFIAGKQDEFSEEHKKSIESYLTKIRAKNKSNIIEIMDAGSKRISSPPLLKDETFLENLNTIKYKTEDFKYEGY